MYFAHTSHSHASHSIAKPYVMGVQAQLTTENIVRSPINALSCGDHVASPSGRHLQVDDVFVPKHNKEKSHNLPARFRSFNRKIVIFKNGAIAPLKEVQANYQVLVAQ